MLIVNICLTGKTPDDVWYAMEEVWHRIADGDTTGVAQNESGSFSFSFALSGSKES